MKYFLLFVFVFCAGSVSAQVEVSPQTAKPWTYWWWMGSAVNREGISRELRQFADSGLGGVHIIPIYGAKGYEDQFLDFFSEEWLEMVQFTIEEAAELGMGVDLSLAAGWPYGGPWLGREDVAMRGEMINIPLLDVREMYFDPEAIRARNGFVELLSAFLISEGRMIDLTHRLSEPAVSLPLTRGDWQFRAFGMKPTGQQVKRAGPGGEGPVVNYLSRPAVGHYLEHFDSILALTAFPITPRAFHHESYEAYDAGFTPGLVDSFLSFHEYPLTAFAPLTPGELKSDDSLLIHDVRLLIDHLLYNAFAKQWTKWTKRMGATSRYQAHGSPANILDLYALAGIPETEAFGCSGFPIPGLNCDSDYNAERFERPEPLMMKFASSPAHLLGKPLVSGEVGTWLANHFKLSLRKVKPEIDQLFVGGVNHIFYQGSTYSPPEAGYPGWLNYAASNFGASAAFHDELPLLNRYVTRCQEKLQAARPDNDVLVFFPLPDYWAKRPLPVLRYLDVHDHRDWFDETSFGSLTRRLSEAGYAFDYLSNRQLLRLEVDESGGLQVPGGSGRYRTIVIPEIDYVDYRSMRVLQRLASQGVTLVFENHLPVDYADMTHYQSEETPAGRMRGARVRERVVVSRDVVRDLDRVVPDVRRENLREAGMQFIRKETPTGTLYFVVNLGATAVTAPFRLNTRDPYVTVTDPLTGKIGYLETAEALRLDLPPGKSYFLETTRELPDLPPWIDLGVADRYALTGPWEVSFTDGRGDTPATVFHPEQLTTWTRWGNDTLESFAGKARYRTTFTLDSVLAGEYRLVLDRVHESAEVILNGVSQGTVWSFPNTLKLGRQNLRRENVLELVVQNLDANYLRKYDTEHPEWKNFYDVNFVGITYRPFSAGWWDLMDSGVIGPVVLERRTASGTDADAGF